MSCVKVFDLPSIEAKLKELHKITEKEDFWGSPEAQEVSREFSRCQASLDRAAEMRGEFEDIETIAEILAEAEDPELEKEFYSRAEKLEKVIEEYQTLILLDGEYDAGDAIMTVSYTHLTLPTILRV